MTDEIRPASREGRRGWAWFVGVLLLLAAGGLGFLWWKAPDWYAGGSAVDRPGSVATTRIGFAVAFVGVSVLAGLLVNARAVRTAQRSHRGLLAGTFGRWEALWAAEREEGRAERLAQVTDRYTAAVEQLGDPGRISVRLGGIYALERIAVDSERDHPTVVEVLSAFVRENARRRAPSAGIDVLGVDNRSMNGTRPATDVQAALTVLGRLPERPGIPRADLTGADLTGADLIRATLSGATLAGANLAGAWLVGANLGGARLVDVNLTGARLDQARLTGAKLDVADLTNSRLDGADLTGARLAAADLTNARSLSQAQVEAAQGDHRTKLPTGIRQPLSWLLPSVDHALPRGSAPKPTPAFGPGDTAPTGPSRR